ncbi:PREDICTED: CMRF35-like molecule 2 [Ceratotherium simum simum]|uniref:CMRF35-like molecule 2 n=1 Tax=Ceratotherium simum simum TaxID=73337 RepID=A0ABM1CZA9_CERSS|nr:PREDICTED: CMRF35-like molecule 2 [Ceratotherium simum simum]
MWLLPAMLLLCIPGCLSLMGPSCVTGTMGNSLSVQCQYEERYKAYNKYWCRGQYDTTCDVIVETKGEEKDERNGRVSIRDRADKLTFTVTMENLNADDAGSYWCGIQTVWILDAWSRDPSVQVKVSVSPAPGTTTGTTRCPVAPATLPVVNTGQNLSTRKVLTHSSGSQPSNVHFLLLVFLKLPLFLSMLTAVLWVNRPQRGPRGRQSQPDQGNRPCSALAPGRLSLGGQPFRLDKRDLQTLDSRAGGLQCLDSGGTRVFWGCCSCASMESSGS